jgi:hypothetical protein
LGALIIGVGTAGVGTAAAQALAIRTPRDVASRRVRSFIISPFEGSQPQQWAGDHRSVDEPQKRSLLKRKKPRTLREYATAGLSRETAMTGQ